MSFRTRYLFLLFLWCAGCSGLELPETTTRLDPETLEQPAKQPRVQILVTYNGPMSTHAALRLEYPRRAPLFWDPAGLYGSQPDEAEHTTRTVAVQRNNDLIWHEAPTLPAYWDFVVTTGDTAMEVLEWPLSEKRAEELYELLVASAQGDGSTTGFSTKTTEPLCAIAVSDFLRRFGRGIVQVPDSYLFPTSLAEQLRKQKPTRILIFSTEAPLVEYRTKENSELRNLDISDG